MAIKHRKKELSDLVYEFNNSEDALSVLIYFFSQISSPDHEMIYFVNNNLLQEKLKSLKFSVIKFTDDYIIYINAQGEISFADDSKETIKFILNEVKQYDSENKDDDSSQGLRTALLIFAKGNIRSYDAYTNIDFEGLSPKKIKQLLEDSRIWTSQRSKLHQAIIDDYFRNIEYFSRKIEESPDLGRGLYCIRGGVASGKSTFVKNYLNDISSTFGGVEGTINTDNIKRALIRKSENEGGCNLSMYLVHEEGSMISKRLLVRSKNENLSYFLDKRMHEKSDLIELLDDAKTRSLPITIFDIEADFATSAMRVLNRTGKYPSDPTPDFEGLYKSYKKIEQGRKFFFDNAIRSTAVKNYYLISSSSGKSPIISVLKRDYKVIPAINFSKAAPFLDRKHLEENIISSDHIDSMNQNVFMENDLTKYIGTTLYDALNRHSQKSYKSQFTKGEYGMKLTKNIEETSRSFNGKINVSASLDKKQKMNMALSEKEIRQFVQSNIQSAFEYIYDNSHLILHNPSVLKRFINEVAWRVNRDLIIDKKHLLRDGENSYRYNYVDTKFVEKFYNVFIEELYKRLMDVESDTIETAAWVEWNIDFAGHIFSDGCGRIAKLLSSWILIRRDFPLPSFENGLSGFQSIRESYKKQFSLRKKPTYYSPKDTKEYKAFLSYYKKLFEKMNFSHVLAAGGLIFNSSGQFLILKSTKYEGQWVLPGGKMEPGENPVGTFKREVFEETNLQIKNIHLLGNRMYTSPRGNRYSFFDYSALALDEKHILINHESYAYQWVKADQLDNYKFSNSIKDFFKKYSDLHEKIL